MASRSLARCAGLHCVAVENASRLEGEREGEGGFGISKRVNGVFALLLNPNPRARSLHSPGAVSVGRAERQ